METEGIEVKIINLRLTRNQVIRVRAIFTVDVGPMRLINCCLVGTRQQAPETMTVTLPGRWSEDRSSWKTLVVATPAVHKQIQEKALAEYQSLIETMIERNAPKMPAYLYG